MASIGVCSPASAAADIQAEDNNNDADNNDADVPVEAHGLEPTAEPVKQAQASTAACASPPTITPESKFAAAAEAAKNAIATVNTDGKRGRRRGAATRVTDVASTHDTAEEQPSKDDSTWRRGCTPSMPTLPAMPSLPTREGLAGRLSCASARKDESDNGAEVSSPSLIQRFSCTAGRKEPASASEPESMATAEAAAAAAAADVPAGYLQRLGAAASCGVPAVDGQSEDAAAPVSALGRVRAAVSCGVPSAGVGAESKGIGARVREGLSCAAGRGGEGVEGDDAVSGAETDDGAKNTSLLSRLKEAGTCSPVTQVRMQAAMSHLPELPKMPALPQMPAHLSCGAQRAPDAHGEEEDAGDKAATPSMLGRVKAVASCGYLPATHATSSTPMTDLDPQAECTAEEAAAAAEAAVADGAGGGDARTWAAGVANNLHSASERIKSVASAASCTRAAGAEEGKESAQEGKEGEETGQGGDGSGEEAPGMLARIRSAATCGAPAGRRISEMESGAEGSGGVDAVGAGGAGGDGMTLSQRLSCYSARSKLSSAKLPSTGAGAGAGEEEVSSPRSADR